MGEHYANIWPLDGVRHWHVLTAICGRCRHREPLRLPELKAQHPELVYLHEIEPWLVCAHCGNRLRNRVELGKINRNF
jgi:hypothetical protein